MELDEKAIRAALESVATAWGDAVPEVSDTEKVAMLYIAISLKRIADAQEKLAKYYVGPGR
jgi:hypothetical protein